jgi:DNA-binding CsgD family transcriptional regulator
MSLIAVDPARTSATDGPPGADAPGVIAGLDLAGVRRMTAGLELMRTLRSADQVVEHLPDAACRLGLGRAMVSRIAGTGWVVERYHDPKSSARAAQITAAFRDVDLRLHPWLAESDAVRRRRPMRVLDARGNRRVDPTLVAMTGSTSYVVAPIIAGSRAIGLVHADHDHGAPVTELDQELVWALAGEAGASLERAGITASVLSMSKTVESLSEALNGLGERAVDDWRDQSGIATAAPTECVRSWGPLTGREVEVLRLIAAGDTNTAIAQRLFISEGTVKSHVRHILRKLRAANRAEAVSRWHNGLRIA